MSRGWVAPASDELTLDKTDVVELAAAIARGDCAAAAESLDHIARAEPTIAEWIAQGRASNLAHPRPLMLAHVNAHASAA